MTGFKQSLGPRLGCRVDALTMFGLNKMPS
uniref:Uncharacterized protein n=1 Tax=Nelumbo nucifera TaxID=4432 RepID=A0A822ZT72_NELNU|nr:TPA_asm: hypothetical protein HUJ06_016688 [Nelumbo nucifera]